MGNYKKYYIYCSKYWLGNKVNFNYSRVNKYTLKFNVLWEMWEKMIDKLNSLRKYG